MENNLTYDKYSRVLKFNWNKGQQWERKTQKMPPTQVLITKKYSPRLSNIVADRMLLKWRTNILTQFHQSVFLLAVFHVTKINFPAPQLFVLIAPLLPTSKLSCKISNYDRLILKRITRTKVIKNRWEKIIFLSQPWTGLLIKNLCLYG